jgi:toxin FitB
VAYLLDTNVVSETFRTSPHPAVIQWWEAAQGPFYVSVLVLGEIRRGIERLAPRDPRRAQALDERLAGIAQTYSGLTLPVTAAISDVWGRLGAVRPLPDVDGLLAATAIVHDLTLVTRNIKHVEGLEVPVVNPFSDRPQR